MLPFQVVRAPAVMRALAEDQRRDGRSIAVVPTMGYLHEGHLSLLRAGRTRSDLLIMTLFVNPTQFGPTEDLARYPRDEERDLDLARQCGVNVAFCPDVISMYPKGYQTHVQVRELKKPLCGASRPVHFDGVASIVTKLFHLTMPHLAVFGEKDFQQLALIRRMVRDLDFDIEILGMPIVREADGLAMSSRNAYLSPDEREQALSLNSGLKEASASFDSGERDAKTLLAIAREPIDAAPLANIEYVELRDAESLEPVDAAAQACVLAMAVRFGGTRLIDNAVLRPQSCPPQR